MIGNKDYIINRGVKPNKFEIYENGRLFNQDAAARDYQEVIDYVVDNAIKLYNRTAAAAQNMSARDFMPQMDKGGSPPEAKIDALKKGVVDWNAPYDQGDIKSSAVKSKQKSFVGKAKGFLGLNENAQNRKRHARLSKKDLRKIILKEIKRN